MAEFIDRQEEMQTLDNEYARKCSSFVVLYGRRRVGKTTLISEFIKISIIYSCYVYDFLFCKGTLYHQNLIIWFA